MLAPFWPKKQQNPSDSAPLTVKHFLSWYSLAPHWCLVWQYTIWQYQNTINVKYLVQRLLWNLYWLVFSLSNRKARNLLNRICVEGKIPESLVRNFDVYFLFFCLFRLLIHVCLLIKISHAMSSNSFKTNSVITCFRCHYQLLLLVNKSLKWWYQLAKLDLSLVS